MKRRLPAHYSLAEARAALPEIQKALLQIHTLRRRLSKTAHRLESVNPSHQAAKDRKLLIAMMAESRDLLNGISDTGVLVRDLESGLIDFPSKRNGKDIFLCYELGEEDIDYWHGINEGKNGRKPV